MIEPELKKLVEKLHQTGQSQRSISKLLGISRHSVRGALAEEEAQPPVKNRDQELVDKIKPLIRECQSNLVRVHERLASEHQEELAYSTLTYLVRKYDLLEKKKPRVGVYQFAGGEEMQHDTSPHKVIIAGQQVKTQCASLVLAFSRRIFIQYYPCFTRFEAKIFLQQALEFMQGSCKRCMVDNTNVILAAGSGENAKIAADMKVFEKLYGFKFAAHRINHPGRKGRVERPFYYVETNFLAGRKFNDWEDLNTQAQQWCETVNSKPKRVLGMSPDAAYLQEKPYLQPLPEVSPPIYQVYQRRVDTYGYVSLDNNRYSVPEKLIGCEVNVYKYLNKVMVYFKHHPMATHRRIIGKKDQHSTIKEHHSSLIIRSNQQLCSEAEKQLADCSPQVAEYIKQLKSQVRGRGVWQFKKLLYLKQTYSSPAFIAAIKQASKYGLYDMNRIEDLIIKYASTNLFQL